MRGVFHLSPFVFHLSPHLDRCRDGRGGKGRLRHRISRARCSGRRLRLPHRPNGRCGVQWRGRAQTSKREPPGRTSLARRPARPLRTALPRGGRIQAPPRTRTTAAGRLSPRPAVRTPPPRAVAMCARMPYGLGSGAGRCWWDMAS